MWAHIVNLLQRDPRDPRDPLAILIREQRAMLKNILKLNKESRLCVPFKIPQTGRADAQEESLCLARPAGGRSYRSCTDIRTLGSSNDHVTHSRCNSATRNTHDVHWKFGACKTHLAPFTSGILWQVGAACHHHSSSPSASSSEKGCLCFTN